jgi:hypothetical protein
LTHAGIHPIGGVVALRAAPWKALFALLAGFALDSFVILPLVSRKHACRECPQKDDCPWMGRTPAAKILST